MKPRLPKSLEHRTAPAHVAAVGVPLENSPELEELSRQLLGWSRLWVGGRGEHVEGMLLVRERLTAWLARCIGNRAGRLVANRAGDLSLATSTPLLTAFLGRRATRELSRHVLRDL